MVICAGSGGVGKTTVAAALAVRASQLGLRTLVLTVDPAKRLATALGLDLAARVGSLSADRPVPLKSGSLHAAVIDSRQIFDEFLAQHGGGSEAIARIMKNRLYQQLSTTLSGSQEFTALERLLQANESGHYDLVVLDTPPTKHAVDFLTSPQRISALFQDAVTRWFMAPGEKADGFFATLIGRGTRMALKSLETLTGAQFIEELVDFFAAIRSFQSVLRERSEGAHRLLLSDKTNFLVVTSFDAAKLAEAKYLKGELEKMKYRLRAVVINRAFPLGLQAGIEAVPGGVNPAVYEKVFRFYRMFSEYYSARLGLYHEFARGLEPSVQLIRIPEYERDVYGIADLEALAQVLGEGGMK